MDSPTLLAAVVLLAVPLAGCVGPAADVPDAKTETVSPPAEPYPTSVQDVDEGWRSSSEGESSVDHPGFVDGYERKIVGEPSGAYEAIQTQVFIFESIGDAEDYYDQEAGRVSSNYSTDDVSFASEGITYQKSSELYYATVRDRNAIVDTYVATKAPSPTYSAEDAAALAVTNIRSG